MEKMQDFLRLLVGMIVGVIFIFVGIGIWIGVIYASYRISHNSNEILILCVVSICIWHYFVWRMGKSATSGAAAIGVPIIAAILVFPTTLIYGGGLFVRHSLECMWEMIVD